jgi:hypothetical protein
LRQTPWFRCIFVDPENRKKKTKKKKKKKKVGKKTPQQPSEKKPAQNKLPVIGIEQQTTIPFSECVAIETHTKHSMPETKRHQATGRV